MFGIFVYDVIFFAIPVLAIAFLGISIYRYLHAKKANKVTPNTFSASEIKGRKIMLIISVITAGLLAAIVIGFIALLFMAIAFM